MDTQIDLRMVITVAGMIASLGGAAAVAKAQIKIITSKLEDIELRLRQTNLKMEKLYTMTETQEQRITVLASMSSPDQLRRQHMEHAQLQTYVTRLQEDVSHLQKMHNSVHPPVASERKAT